MDERIAKIRSYFDEELSLYIFDKRVEIGSCTVGKQVDNLRWFTESLDLIECRYNSKEMMLNYIQELRNPAREKFIYGAGAGCQSVLFSEPFHVLGLRGVEGIIDNHVKGERYGFPIISFPEFLEQHQGALVLNSVGGLSGKGIHQQCLDVGIEVVSLFEIDKCWDQYFDFYAELGLVGKDEVFVHAGCYNGDTQKSFIDWFGTDYDKMITFEPGVEQYKFCTGLFQQFKNVDLVQAGLSDENVTAKFNIDTFYSRISETGIKEIETVTLDSYVGNRKVTFIALDIEGGEFKALKGAEGIIRNQKPKLAISIYHQPKDIYELPELVKSFRPDYKLYLRHYQALNMNDTVLYAF